MESDCTYSGDFRSIIFNVANAFYRCIFDTIEIRIINPESRSLAKNMRKFVLVLSVWLLTTVIVTANPLDRFGFGTRGPGMGNAYSAGVDDYTATFYNPAALGFMKHPTAGAAITYHDIHLEVDGAVKDEFYDADGDGLVDTAREVETTAKPEDARGLDFGFSLPIGGILRERVALGVGIHLPGGNRIVRVKANDPDEPFFYMYDNDIQKMAILVGAGIRLSDMFSVGGGAMVFVNVPLYIEASINISSSQVAASRNPTSGMIEVELFMTESPIAGVMFRPNDDLSFGLTFRDQISLTFEGDMILDLDMSIDLLSIGGEDIAINLSAPVPLKIKADTLLTPRSFQFGSWWNADLLSEGLRLAFDLSWFEYSAYNGNHLKIYVSDDTVTSLENQINGMLQQYGGILDALPLGGVQFSEQDIYIVTKDFSGMQNFRDIFVPRIGAEYDVFDWWTARIGYFFEPTPVPDQKGITCYVDSDRHVLSFGSTFFVPDPLELAEVPLELGLFGQYHQLETVTTTKQHTDDIATPDTPYDIYKAGGSIYGGGLSVTWKF
jgi:long-chain fatty acid transport protein